MLPVTLKHVPTNLTVNISVANQLTKSTTRFILPNSNTVKFVELLCCINSNPFFRTDNFRSLSYKQICFHLFTLTLLADHFELNTFFAQILLQRSQDFSCSKHV